MSTTTTLTDLAQTVRDNATRVAELGSWPPYIQAEASLLERLPLDGATNAPGFDAGIAVALGLIPEDMQTLSAVLHAAYTKEVVEQVRAELELDNETFAGTESCWWLAACSVCREGGIDEEAFQGQLVEFATLVEDPAARATAARAAYDAMCESFTVHADGIAYAHIDGGMQAAYLDGHPFAVQYNPSYGIFFVGTFEPSLGIPEDFDWSEYTDDEGRPMSGGVHGSRQFVKCATIDELNTVVGYARQTLGVRD